MHTRSQAQTLLAIFLAALITVPALAQNPAPYASSQLDAGPQPDGSFVLPVNQTLHPHGRQLPLPGLRPQVLALSPDRSILATSGKTHDVLILDPTTLEILQRVPMPADPDPSGPAHGASQRILKTDKDAQVSYTGLTFSHNGTRLYLSSVNGSIKVFTVDPNAPLNQRVSPHTAFPLPPSNNTEHPREIPSGIALSPNDTSIFVTASLSNRLLELDATTGKLLRTWDVGFAPYTVLLNTNGTKAWVSNWGGRRPTPLSLTGPAGKGTEVRVDPVRYVASEGSVSIINLKTSTPPTEHLTGLHASALALHPSGRYLIVANASSDTLSVLDTRSDQLLETIPTRWNPSDGPGATPNALAFNTSGDQLFVANGNQNSIAILRFLPGHSKLLGLVPVGWFPGALAFDPTRNLLTVANIKGSGSGKTSPNDTAPKFNSHQHQGSLSAFTPPNRTELASLTAQALKDLRHSTLEAAKLPPRPGTLPRPVPERAGEPSVFKHVIYIIKENRTYDQVLGDMPEGRGNKDLCIFGERVTPNQHKLCRDFTLLDNTLCSGILSADGHQWADTGFATDYLEKSFAGWPRSYPDGMEDSDLDALAYSPAGFIWDAVLARGKTFRDYGEFAIGITAWKDPANKRPLRFIDHYRDFVDKTDRIHVQSRHAIESVRPHLCTDTIGWDMKVPDVLRANRFIRELHEFEQNGRFPNFLVICLPNDHTSGTSAGAPTPAAQVADNDLAFGQIVEAVSQSKFWKETCIFAIEDDPQGGWDHISGYRTTAYVVSPYTRRHAVVHTQYNQTSLLRTMELMLQVPPMNIFDASATPMFDCFTETPDFTPFTALPNLVPLDELNPAPRAIHDPVRRQFALASASLPLEKPDQCPEDLLNRILWNAMKGSQALYPSWALTHLPDHDDD